jgi:formate dehydrogenase major subunit
MTEEYRPSAGRRARFAADPAWDEQPMALGDLIASWPVLRQLREGDPLGLGRAARSPRSAGLVPRIEEADHVVQSVCPYCAVGCGQLV